MQWKKSNEQRKISSLLSRRRMNSPSHIHVVRFVQKIRRIHVKMRLIGLGLHQMRTSAPLCSLKSKINRILLICLKRAQVWTKFCLTTVRRLLLEFMRTEPWSTRGTIALISDWIIEMYRSASVARQLKNVSPGPSYSSHHREAVARQPKVKTNEEFEYNGSVSHFSYSHRKQKLSKRRERWRTHRRCHRISNGFSIKPWRSALILSMPRTSVIFSSNAFKRWFRSMTERPRPFLINRAEIYMCTRCACPKVAHRPLRTANSLFNAWKALGNEAK